MESILSTEHKSTDINQDMDNNRDNNLNNYKSRVNNYNDNNNSANNSNNDNNINNSDSNSKSDTNNNNNMYNNNSKANSNNNNNSNNESHGDNRKEASKNDQETEKIKQENDDLKDKKISEFGQTVLDNNNKEHKIHLLSIIGEIEGHECLPQHNKTTKYEHVLPQLAAIEDSSEIDGLLILINTVGGDVEAGLAIAEMIASLSKPTVSLVLGGSHSIGIPLAVSADYSFIVPTATMIIHPVRMNGTVIGVTQTFEYIEKIQDRIIKFVVNHSDIGYKEFKNLMLTTNQLAKDVGSILVGEETVKLKIISQVGGIKEAMAKLNNMIDEKDKSMSNNTDN